MDIEHLQQETRGEGESDSPELFRILVAIARAATEALVVLAEEHHEEVSMTAVHYCPADNLTWPCEVGRLAAAVAELEAL